MGIIVANAYALSLSASDDAALPIIGWQSLVTASNITADEEEPLYPATNLANPSTALLWRSGSLSTQNVTSLFDATEIDYGGLARHNLGSGSCSVIVQGLPPGGDPDTDGDWVELVPEQLLADDSPVLFRFEPDIYIGLRLVLTPGSVEPEAAVLYVGKLLVFERGVQPGFTPINYGRSPNVANLRSVAGDFLGRIVLGGMLSTTATINYLSADWYRSTLDPFFKAAAETPFFWAWSPEDYPKEVGFVWLTSDPKAQIADMPGRFNVTMNMEGIIS